MRAALDRLYQASAVLACIFFAAIGVCIVLQVATRLMGLHVPGLIDYATYSMVASTFFGLGYALKRGAHIRVTLILGATHGAARRVLETISLAIGAAILTYFAYYAVQMAYDSYRFGMRDLGLAATPLWIPQSGMAAGAVIGAIAFVDELIRALRGRPLAYDGVAPSPDDDPSPAKVG